MAAIFCSQVLKIPLNLLSRTDCTDFLEALGFNVDNMKEEDYQSETILLRIIEFCNMFNSFNEKRKEVSAKFGIGEGGHAFGG